jgi:hypothetical protein
MIPTDPRPTDLAARTMKVARLETTDALSVWENEGGGLGAIQSTSVSSRANINDDEILRHLGHALVSHWHELPQPFQQSLFWELSTQKIGAGQQGLKGSIARYLHVNGRSGKTSTP